MPMCLCTCVYVCVHVCVYLCACVPMYTVCMYVCVPLCVCMCMCVCVPVCVHVHMCMWACVCVHVGGACVCTCACVWACVCAHMCVCMCVLSTHFANAVAIHSHIKKHRNRSGHELLRKGFPELPLSIYHLYTANKRQGYVRGQPRLHSHGYIERSCLKKNSYTK